MTEPRPSDEPVEQPATAEDDLSFEEARDELVETVRALEAGGTTLEESVALWERGERLARLCQQRLSGVRRRLDAAMAADHDAAAPDGDPD